MLRLGIVTIAYKFDSSLNSTILSVRKLAETMSSSFEIVHALVVSRDDLSSINNIVKSPNKSPNLTYLSAVGKDHGLYSAMNIGANLIRSQTDFIVFLNSGVTLNHDFSADSLANSLKANPSKILFASSLEIIDKLNNKRIWQPIDSKRWPSKLPIMPCCHHSIFYPSSVFADFYFLAMPGYLASDYLHLISLVNSGRDYHFCSEIFAIYSNNGLSSAMPYKSIKQRIIAFYLAFNTPWLSLLFLGIYSAKHALRSIFYCYSKFIK